MFNFLKDLLGLGGPSINGFKYTRPENKEYAPARQAEVDLGDYSVSMYNPRRNQTDADPWIAPRNFDLKKGTESGGKYLAVARKGKDDPRPMVPYGTRVKIGNDVYEVRDLMGLYANGEPQWGVKRFDIFHPDESDAGYQHAINFGRKNLRASALDDPWPME